MSDARHIVEFPRQLAEQVRLLRPRLWAAHGTGGVPPTAWTGDLAYAAWGWWIHLREGRRPPRKDRADAEMAYTILTGASWRGSAPHLYQEVVRLWLKRRERYVSRHARDYRPGGTIAMIKWAAVFPWAERVAPGRGYTLMLDTLELAVTDDGRVYEQELTGRGIRANPSLPTPSNIATVYHVGPPRVGEWNLDRAGAGEGMSLLGPGLYVVSDPGVAARYARYHTAPWLYTMRLDTTGFYDPTHGRPLRLRAAVSAAADAVREATTYYREWVDPLRYGKGTIGSIVHALGPRAARGLLGAAGVMGAYEILPGGGVEYACFHPNRSLTLTTATPL